jgi:hypothetical protein
LVVTDDDLRRDRAGTMKNVFRFLGVDDSFTSPHFERMLHRSDYKRRKTAMGMRIASMIHKLDLDSGVLPIRSAHVELVLCYPFSRRIERPVLDDSLKTELRARLAGDLAELRRFTGRDFAEWET